jgi:hypothetical protein
MIRSRLALAALVSLPILAAGPALAGTDVPLPPFSGIELHGGGNVILRHGPVQRVTILKGDTKHSKLEVKGGTLDIGGCLSNWGCGWGYSLEVEIVTPGITALSVHGGGDLVAKGEFPVQNAMSVSVHGGGDADIRAIPVKNLTAAVHGGGDLYAFVTDTLTANVHGGGSIVYKGNPRVTSSVHGGGSISKE